MQEKDFSKRFGDDKPKESRAGRFIIGAFAFVCIFLSNYIQTPNGFASIAAAGVCGAVGAAIGYGIARLFKAKI